MDELRPPLPDERNRLERMVSRGFAWLFGGVFAIGTLAIIFEGIELVFAGLAVAWVALIVTRFAMAKNEYARTHRPSN